MNHARTIAHFEITEVEELYAVPGTMARLTSGEFETQLVAQLRCTEHPKADDQPLFSKIIRGFNHDLVEARLAAIMEAHDRRLHA